MTTYTDAGDGFDVAIGGLPFKLDVSKDRPYERATAQFRKEQFDSAPTVGDQSLTGWWTRGQLSFHRGAGINYYEVLEGETVLNRFKDCEGVSVFTPGQVTLAPSLSSPSVAATDAVPAPLSGGGGVYALTAAGVKYTNGVGSTAIATSDSVVPTSITSSGSLYYVTNGTKIERQYAAADARVNHVTNPSFEAGTGSYDSVSLTGWTKGTTAPVGESAVGFTRTTGGKYGSHAMYFNYYTGVNGYPIWAETTVSGLTIGAVYVMSAWVQFSGTGSGSAITATIAGASVNSATMTEGWMNVRLVFTATATSHALRFTGNVSPGGTTPAFLVDAVMVTESPFAGDYFDGSQPGCSWQGTPNLSKSNYVTASSGASTVRVTNTSGSWKKVWWAKGRLWAVDDSNRLYAVADAVASVSSTAAFWTSTNLSPIWSLTDSPGAVFISDGSDIFAVTVDASGVVPTLGTPTTAARLPLGEQVVDLAFYLSNLVITTTRGVRIAIVQNDQIILGPLTIEGDFSKSVRCGSFNATTYVAGRLSGRSGNVVLCAIDLTSPDPNTLTYAWSPVATLAATASTADGCSLDPTGRIFPWSAADLKVASLDELSSTGYLTTGFHRFGTLEKKAFASVTCRLRGTGTLGVYQIADDESETLLATLDAASGVGEVPLPTAPTERIALKFVLTRDPLDSTRGPTLLGYQLKALPAPKRQRMIRLPLMLMDVERRGGAPATGYEGSAWDRLSALETMEAAGATYTFQDFRTGETGEVFIESVEHRGETPPGDRSNGFGGTIWLTLRKLA